MPDGCSCASAPETLPAFHSAGGYATGAGKDIWALKKLDIPIKENPIYKTETLDFTGILQEGLREEVKQAIFLHIKYEKIGTVKRELTSIRKFSGYLMEKGVKINSCADVDRDLLEEYLVYINTNGSSGRGTAMTF